MRFKLVCYEILRKIRRRLFKLTEPQYIMYSAYYAQLKYGHYDKKILMKKQNDI